MQAEGELERKFAVPGALTVTDGTRIEGYASVFGVRDRGGDVVMPGAYAASLARMAAAGRRVKLLWQHDAAQPIGVWDEIAEDGHGLRVKGRLLTEVGRGREAVALLEAGESVTEAALGCGYDSTSAYIAAFKQLFGATPGELKL